MSVSLIAKARIMGALLAVCMLFVFSGTLAAQVTLYPTASPSSAQAGVQVITLSGFGFPDGNIHPTDVLVKLSPVSSGTPAQAVALEATRISGSTVRVRFTIPSSLSIISSTDYNISLSGQTLDGVKFSSSNSTPLTVLPPSSVTLSPGEGQSGSTVWVDVSGLQTNFVQGSTYARFGAGASVGGGTLGDYGLVTVNSATSARAMVTIDPTAAPGPRTVVVLTGTQQATAAFSVTAPYQPPIANAGPQQRVKPGEIVQLDGSRSTSPSGAPLQYTWSFVSVPAGSRAALSNNSVVNPTFATDYAGDYVVQLTVNDGTAVTSASVTITMQDTAPVANAGANQSANPGDWVTLDGSGSTDADGDQLTYLWSFKSKPQGSAAVLSDKTAITPRFMVDALGTYVLQLTVDDGHGNSSTSTVNISTANQPPTADAGTAITAAIGTSVRLDGTRSSDPDNDPLLYSWSLISRPQGSSTVLLDANTATPAFVADVAGNYVAQLTVNDQHSHTAAATVAISTLNSPPTADAGAAQSVNVGDTVYLSGSKSSDPDGDKLTYSWSLVAKPAGSTATLTSTGAVNTSFVADVAGSFVAQLIVSDPTSSGAPATVLVTVTAAKPSVAPQLVNFGDQPVSVTSNSRSVVITNTNSAPMTLSEITISGSDAGHFRATAPSLPMVVPAGESTSVNVTFTPIAPGARSAMLVVNQGPSGSQATQLTGNGVSSPTIGYTPGSLLFPDQPVGVVSNTLPVTVTNSGSSDLVLSSFTLSGPNPQDFGFTSANLPITIHPGQSSTVNFTFKPTAAGQRSAVMLISDNASGSPHAITMSGNGLAPVLVANPAAVVFADQALTVASSASGISIKNTGTAPLTISALTVAGTNASEFAVSSDALPITISPGSSSLLSVTFTPAAVGSRTANLVVTDNASGSPHSIPLSGKGITVPGIQVLTPTVDFADVVVSQSKNAALQVKNTGTSNLIISGVTFGGANPGDFKATATVFPVTIVPGATGTLTLTFTPPATGARTGTVTLVHNATGVVTATLTGNGTAAGINLGASSVDFGKQLINTKSAAKTLTITNSGTADLTINSLGISGPAAADYATPTAAPILLHAGEVATVSLTFTPSATGARTASLVINDTAAGSPHSVTLTGTGTAAAISVNPTTVTFGNQRVNIASTAKSVTITNTGTADLTISALSVAGTNAAHFSFTSSTLPITVTPNATTVVSVTYTPTAVGPSSATLSITNSAGAAQSVTLSGTGVSGDTTATFNPSPLDLGSSPVGTVSAVKNIIVNNTGSASLSITGIQISGANASDFNFSSPALPITVVPGNFAGIGLTVKPSAVGPRTATITFTDNADGSPHTVTLNGKGQGVPVVDLPATALDFGPQNVGTPSAPKSIVIGNKGTDDLVITAVSVAGTNAADFSSAPAVPITVAAGSTVSIPVVFNPAAIGNKSASLRLVDNSAGSPHLAGLTGVGTKPGISVAPPSLNFGSRAVNTTSAGSAVTLTNTGSGLLTISNLAINGANTTDFAFTSPSLPIQIQPNSTASVTVTFTPQATGSRSANLTITHDATGGSTTVALSGTGAPNGPTADASPTSLAFGNQPLASPAAVKTVTITNNGNQDLSITAVGATGANAGDFSATAAGPLPLKVVAGSSTSIQVSFKPTVKGSRVGNLSVTHNATSSPTLIPLSGTGTAPDITVSPTTVDFGTINTGTPSTQKNITVSNPGTAPLVISSVGLSGTNATSFSANAGTLPTTINPGGSITIGVVMTPIQGPNTAALTIGHNAAGGSSTVSLTGAGGNVGVTTVSVSPVSLAFGSVDTSTTSTKPVVISNTGGVTLMVSSLTITGPNATDFTISSSTLPISVFPGGSIAVSINFKPGDIGARSAVLTISDNGNGSPRQVALSGAGFINGAAIRLDRTSLNFPDQLKGTTSAPLTITVTNPGNADLSISSLRFSGAQGGDFSFSPAVSTPVVVPKSGGTKTLSVVFTPTDFGSRSATLTITSNAKTPTVTVSLAGNGTGPIISFTPQQGPLDFGSQPALTTSASKQLVISNAGTGNLTINSLNVPITQFQVAPVQLPLVIPAGQSATLNISFAPSAAQTYNTTLNIGDNAAGAPHSFALTGVGVAGQMSFMPSDKLDFGSQEVSKQSAPKPVALVNSGSITLVITSVSLSGTNQADFSIAPLTLPAFIDPGKNLPVSITFTPGARGARSANLVVANNATGSPQTLPITGSGAGPVIVLSASTVTFGSQIVGVSSNPPADLVITNNGDAALAIAGATITGANATDFTAPIGPFPLSVGPSQSVHVPVTFTPSSTGTRSATFSISHNASGSPSTVTFTGVGVPRPVITPNPGSLTFGNQILNTASAAKNISLSNTGGSPLIITAFTVTGTNAGDFALTSNQLPLTVNPGASTPISVTFTPAGPPVAPAGRTAIISIASNVPGAPTTIALAGTAVGEAKFVLGTNPIAFGSQFVGSASAPFALQVSNPGTADVHITNITPGGNFPNDFTIVNPGLPLTIPAGSSATLNVVFTPASTGPRSASFTFADDGTGNPHVLQVNGTGVQPVIKLTPPNNAISFGTQLVPTPSAPQNLNIANIGTADLIINSLVFSGNQGSEFTTAQTTPFTIPANGNVNVPIVFTPLATGTRQGTLTINHNAGSAISVALTGTGTKPNLTFSPASATNDFGQVIVGNTSNPFPITIGNNGTGPLNISAINLAGQNPGDFTVTTPTLPVTVGAGSTITITTNFKPTADGARTAVIQVVSNNDSSPNAFTLNGTGKTIAKLQLSSSTVNFPNQLVGTTSSPIVVTVTNSGSANLNITALNVTGAQSTEFLVTPQSQLPITVVPGANTQLSITFTPGSLKPSTTRTATLAVVSNASSSPDNVTLTGTAFGVQQFSGPALVDVGGQRLNTPSAPNPVTITNTGTADLHINSISVSGANANEFTIPNGLAPSTVAPGANFVVNVTFTPGALGVRNANLNFVDDAQGSPHVVALKGTGTFPSIGTTPAGTLNFPDQSVQTAGSPVTLTINNTGTADLIISSISLAGNNPGDFTFAPVTLPLTITAGQSFNLSLTFKPALTGARTAFLNISHNAAGAVLSVQLTGNGVQSLFQSSPSGSNGLQFGTVAVGAASAAQNITVTNGGTGPLVITALQFIGANPSDFAVSQPVMQSLPITVAAGANTQVPVTFSPAATGARSASLRFTDNAPGNPHTVGVAGTGVQGSLTIVTNPPSNPPSSPAVSFGNQAVNTASAAKIITVQNSGAVDINITAFTFSGANASEFSFSPAPTLPIKLSANQSTTIGVVFTPTASGARSGSIQLTDDASGPSSIALTGVGTQPQISLSPANNPFDLGKQALNGTAQKQLTINNTGNGDLVISALTVSGANANEFTVTLTSGTLPLTIQAGKNASVNINFTPAAEGARNASLSIVHNAPNSPTQLGLTGTGVTPVFNALPNSLTFPAQNLQEASPQQTINVSNTGNGDLVISSIGLTGANPADFQVSNPTLPITIAPSTSVPVNVVFKPTTHIGASSASVTFQDNSNGAPHSVPVNGTAVGPVFSPSPASLNFGNVNVGTPAQQPISITNTGSGDLVITNIQLTGDPNLIPDYTLTAAQLPIRVSPGQKTTVVVNFKPSAPFLRSVGISFTDNALDSPQAYAITATGVGPQFTGPATQPIEFPKENVGVASPVQQVTIQNTGNAALVISSAKLAGDAAADFLLAGVPTPLSIQAGASYNISVVFKPKSSNPPDRNANITIVDNASGSPHTILLHGPASVPTACVNPPQLTVGYNLETVGSLSLNGAAGADLPVTITSSDPSLALLSSDTSGATLGSQSITMTIPAGATALLPGFYVQGLASSGTATLTFTAPGLTNSCSVGVKLIPSGFILASPAGTGAAFTTVIGGNDSQLTVFPATAVQLNGDGSVNSFTGGKIRGGANIPVTVTTDNPAVGVINGTASFLAGATNSGGATFHPVGGGSTTVSVVQPSGFVNLSGGTSLLATVNAPAIRISPVTVGANLQVRAVGTIDAPAPQNGLTVTLTSSNPSLLTLSASQSTAGSGTLQLIVPGGTTSLPAFYVFGMTGTGGAHISVSAPGYIDGATLSLVPSPHYGDVSVTPSGFVVAGPGLSAGQEFDTTTISGNSRLTLTVVRLDPNGNPVDNGMLRAGIANFSVPVASSAPSVGGIVNSPATFGSGGTTSSSLFFSPLKQGSTTVSVGTPGLAGFSTPASGGSLLAVVTQPSILFSLPTNSVGVNLEIQGSGKLTANTPTALPITISSNDAGVLLSSDAAAVGSNSIQITVPQQQGLDGSGFPTFYIQALPSALGHNVTLTASANGWTSATTAITVTPSGFVLISPNGLGADFGTTKTSADVALAVSARQLQAGTFVPQTTQQLRPGLSLPPNTFPVTVVSDSSLVGTVFDGPAGFNGGDENVTVHFRANNQGTTLLHITQPTGFSTPSTGASLHATVN